MLTTTIKSNNPRSMIPNVSIRFGFLTLFELLH